MKIFAVNIYTNEQIDRLHMKKMHYTVILRIVAVISGILS